MTVPNVVAGTQQLLASDVNTHINQTNTNTGDIASHTSTLATHTSQISTANSNISTNTSNISTNTSNISTNTSNISTLQSQMSALGATRMSHFSGSGSGTYSHGLGANPDIVIVQYAGNFGTAPTQVPAYYNTTSSQVTIAAQGGYTWNALAIKF